MSSRFPSVTRAVIRVLEIAGAGLTSAVVAYLLGRTEAPPPAPTPAVVHLAPADEEMIRTVRSDQVALLDQLRGNAEARKPPANSSASSVSAATPSTSSAPQPQAAPQPTQPAVQAQAPTARQATAAEASTQSASQPLPQAQAAAQAQAAVQSPASAQQAAPQSAPAPQAAEASATPTVAAPQPPAAPAQPPAAPAVASAEATKHEAASPAGTTDVAVSATDLQNPSVSPKPVKAAAAQPAVRRDAKPERVHVAEPKARTSTHATRVTARPEPRVEELQVRGGYGGAPGYGGMIDPNARYVVQPEPVVVAAPAAPAPAPENSAGLASAFRSFTGRLLPSRDRMPVTDADAVRPPMPVGDFQQSAMSGGMRSGVSDF